MKKNPSLIISAGKGCFTCCRGCYQFFGKKQLETIDLLNFVNKYKEKFNPDHVTLAGGDPMTRTDIVYLIDEINKMNLNIHIDTVGKNFIQDSSIAFYDFGIAKYIDPRILKDKITKIGIPLDGYNDQQVNHFRENITVSEIISIVKKLNSLDFNICINTVVNKKNIFNLIDIYYIIKQFPNVKQWQLFQYTPIGDLGYKNRQLYEVDDNEFKKAIDKLHNSINNCNIEIQAKSNSDRKFNYILVNSDGYVWYPKYNFDNELFLDSDKSSDKIIIGTIFESDILNKINLHLENINKNINIDEEIILN